MDSNRLKELAGITEAVKYLGDYIIVNTTNQTIVDSARSLVAAKTLLQKHKDAAVNPHRFKLFQSV